VRQQALPKCSAIRQRDSAALTFSDDSQVSTLDSVRRHLLGDSLVQGAIADQEHQAAGSLVQSLVHSQVAVGPRESITSPQAPNQVVGSGLVSAMHGNTRELIHHQ
jgi:hypothetical protein